ncbi:MAG: hypothetical protein ACYSU7_14855 [Planctomycetota bacterium]|jgi:hypothetical protein
MYVQSIPLESRPAGGMITSDGDLAFTSNVRPGSVATLRFREVRILTQVLELEQDQFFVGQIIDFDGTLEPEIQGVNIGSFIRFREEHIFSCHTP